MTVTEIGASRRRKEDQRLITGRSRFTDNMTLNGMLHLALVRSPFAHATIAEINVDEARSAPGVIAVLTGRDVADMQGSLPCAWPITPDQKAPPHPSIAVDHVAFSGEVVACIIARTAAAARDAVELVDVDYDELPVVLDIEEAYADTVLAHPELGTNLSASWVFDSGEAGTGGDAVKAIGDSEVVIERTYYQQRVIPAFMEPRSVLVDPTGEQITMWSATQIPHILRLMLSLTLGIAESKVRVIAPDVGGGFGGKLQVTPEEVITMLAARHTGKPCKYTETRSESLMAAHHGRAQVQRLKLSATADGILTGLSVNLIADMGAYLALVGPGVPILGAFMFNSIYKIPAYRFECNNVFTNKPWTDAYRGAGRPEATFAIERLMDDLAFELGIDPIELRRKNWITHEEFPFTTVAGLEYDSGNYEAATEKAMETFGYDALRAEQKQRRDAGDRVQLGIGVSTFTEMCGLAPSRVLGSLAYGAGGWEHAQVRVLPTGNIEVVTGISPHGQGHETSFSQIVADRLGVPYENVEILHGDTQVSQKGLDTYGSRSLVVGGMAVVAATDKVIEKARTVAAHLLEASPDDIEFAAGTFRVKGTDQGMTLGEISLATFAAHNLPDGFEPSLDSDATFDPVNFNFPHGTHLAAMEIDTETGESTVRSYVCVDDIGNVINPMIVDGQVHGGLAQGIAQALFEEAVYDDAGTLVSGSFVDYLVPSAPDLPHYTTDRTETPCTTNVLGVKGVGEAGTIASTPAIVNGVVDALRHLGVRDVRMPCSPFRIWSTIRAAADGAPAGDAGASPTTVDPTTPAQTGLNSSGSLPTGDVK